MQYPTPHHSNLSLVRANLLNGILLTVNSGLKWHVEFMAKERQCGLGNLFVPIPLQQIPHVYRDVCNSQKLQNHHRYMLSNVATRTSWEGGAAV
jgi:hypothetical protein